MVDRVAGAPLKTAVGADSISARDVYGGACFAGAYRMRPYVFVCAPKAQTLPSLLFIIFIYYLKKGGPFMLHLLYALALLLLLSGACAILGEKSNLSPAALSFLPWLRPV